MRPPLTFGAKIRKQLPFQIFIWLGIAFLLVFSYTPMFGVLMAFKDYKITTGIPGIFTSKWVGLRYFREMVTSYNFPLLVRNTLAISLLKLFFSFQVPILPAITISVALTRYNPGTETTRLGQELMKYETVNVPVGLVVPEAETPQSIILANAKNLIPTEETKVFLAPNQTVVSQAYDEMVAKAEQMA